MAGEWIKMRADLFTHPKVFKIADLLGKDELYVVGGLLAFWAWAHSHAVDGRVDGATSHLIDRATRAPGLSDALMSVGWLHVDADGITIPRFDEHNSNSAKERTLKNERQARWRERKNNDHVDVAPSTSASTKASTREEKRREDINPTNTDAAERRFDAFWIAYPKKVGKDAASKAFKKRKVDDELFGKMLSAIEKQKQTPAWTKDAGQFIPNPTTWLNQGRWMDQSDDDGVAYNPLLSGGI